MVDASTPIKRIERERRTEQRVRAMDAHEIVEWVHDLQDALSTAESQLIETGARLLKSAERVAMLKGVAERWAALDAGSWHVERHAAEKRELIEATRAALTKAES